MSNGTIAIYRPYRYGPQTIGTYCYDDDTFYIKNKPLLKVPNIDIQKDVTTVKVLTSNEVMQIEKLFTLKSALLIAAINDRRFLVRFKKKVEIYSIDIEGNLNNLVTEEADNWDLFKDYILVGTLISVLRYEYIHQPPTVIAYNKMTNKYYVNNFIETSLDVKGKPISIKDLKTLYQLYYSMMVNKSNVAINTDKGYEYF